MTIVKFYLPLTAAFAVFSVCAFGDVEREPERSPFSFGADLRIRQEIMHNVPGLPGGGLLSAREYGKTKNHMRFRPRVYAEFKPNEHWRVYSRLTDEFRANLVQKNHSNTFPDELIVDNLFLEGTGLFDGLLDFTAGRQDIYGLYGLDHVFIDGTPGDGSRTVYADMLRTTLHLTEESKLDVFGIYNSDNNPLRWGTRRGRNKRLVGLGGAEPEMDDWGWGVVFGSRLNEDLPYQLFAIEKRTASFHRRAVKHPSTYRELLGAKIVPRLTDELSLQFEGMSEFGENSAGESILAWSGYAGVNWKKATESSVKPFAKVGFHYMSGDEDAANEDGGRSAWDPMWARGVNDCEMFLYGTHYGAGWWSNMIYMKTTAGLDFGARHRLTASAGPMFAAERDGLGGDKGAFKGFLSQVRYDFPIWTAPEVRGAKLDIFGHVLAEFFNPGDYFATDRPAYFVRWQVEVKF